MAENLPTHRRTWRRTDDYTPGTPKVTLVTEALPLPLAPTQVLIKVHAVALNYRDANIANGGNPWPVIPHGILGNDAAGEIIAAGNKVKNLRVGDRGSPVTDTKFVTGRETGRSWLAANEDGVLADYLVFEEHLIAKVPEHLDWVNCAILPCAGATAWSAIKGLTIGQSVFIQGKLRWFLDDLELTHDRNWRGRHVCSQTCPSRWPKSHFKLVQRRQDQEDPGVFPICTHLWR
ncbi:putative alcohol dehydrogenase [Colletotrichum chrysophilum]|uniref:Alcohol dehydrogenase n=1 Tax=Colletotrichum chrysophilum TaxID=1836956 RepID=A0AAD9ASI4_9PEZI|nr:putative alcohol dehydrogenase [Colletotrichum chrysophilum]